ncbi:MAG: hypothetical protein RMJ35_01330 [Phycisphaerales bacterium]|nr:hypothetical protein [Phycisphaerales bacterium]
MIRRVDRILLRVSGLASAVRHYRDVMGLRLLRQDRRLAVFELTDSPTHLVLHDDPDLPAEATYLLVDDVRDLFRRSEQLKLTFVSPPAQVARGYRATVRDAFGAVMLLIDQTLAGTPVEDCRAPAGLFPGVPARCPARPGPLIAIYRKIARTADDLPYTPHFEALYEEYIQPFPDPKPDRAEVWRHLLTIRKSGRLPRLGEATSTPPVLQPEEKQMLRNLLGRDAGKRDRLPYTQRFEEIARKFGEFRGRPLPPHALWRAIATLTK